MIINDAKRHGLKVRPINVQHSEWLCTLEELSEADGSKYSDPLSTIGPDRSAVG
jgi:error-prone DNA polymerase